MNGETGVGGGCVAGGEGGGDLQLVNMTQALLKSVRG